MVVRRGGEDCFWGRGQRGDGDCLCAHFGGCMYGLFVSSDVCMWLVAWSMVPYDMSRAGQIRASKVLDGFKVR